MSSVREVKETSELWKGKNEQVIVGAVNKMWLRCLGWKGTDLYGIWLAREGEKKEEREEEVHEGGPAGGVVGVRFGEEEDVDEVSYHDLLLAERPQRADVFVHRFVPDHQNLQNPPPKTLHPIPPPLLFHRLSSLTHQHHHLYPHPRNSHSLDPNPLRLLPRNTLHPTLSSSKRTGSSRRATSTRERERSGWRVLFC